MADVIIIVGTKRGNERIPAADIKQMTGRAGRKHGGEECVAYIISDEDSSDVFASMEGDAGYEVTSSLWMVDKVAFHLLPEMCAGRVKSVEDISTWYNRSLAVAQGNRVSMDSVIRYLVESEAITNELTPTFLGETAASLYFNPIDLKAWWRNFDEIFSSNLEQDDAAIAWALGNVTTARVTGDFGNQREVLTLCRNAIPPGLTVSQGCMIKTTLWWSALGVVPSGKMKNQMLGLKNDIDRVCQALIRIDKEAAHWGMEAFFKELVWRVKRGIPYPLVELCRLDGVTKGMAQFLDAQGIHNRDELKRSINSLTGELGPDEISILKGVAYGIPRKSS